MYIPELYLALIIGGWLIDSAAKKRRKAAKLAAKAAAARSVHIPTAIPKKTRLIDNDFVVILSLFGLSAALLWLVASFGV